MTSFKNAILKYLFLMKNLKLHYRISRKLLNNTIIVVFANSDYEVILRNWITAMQRINVSNYIVISLDRQIYKSLRRSKINTYLFSTNKSLKDIWVKRVLFLRKILYMGINFIHSDADAIWVCDPQKKFFNNEQFDVVFSQGTIWPPDIHDKWGFVLCCGLFGIKSNKRTLELLDKVYTDVLDSNDDQVSFNRVIYRSGIVWKPKRTYNLIFRDRILICSTEIIRGEAVNYTFALLPHRFFRRIKEDYKTVYIQHLLTEKKSQSIVEMLKEEQLYFLKTDL